MHGAVKQQACRAELVPFSRGMASSTAALAAKQAAVDVSPPPPSPLALLDLQPYGKGRRRYICKLCSTQYTYHVNELRCPCARSSPAQSVRVCTCNRLERPKPPTLSLQAWQAPHAEAFTAWWHRVSDTDAASVLDVGLGAGLGAQIMSWWQLTCAWQCGGAAEDPNRIQHWPEVQAVAEQLLTSPAVVAAGAIGPCAHCVQLMTSLRRHLLA
jgi:hypothetical protein